jgi:glycosyltransferase involved in cell wall biosynthesis
MGKRVLAMVTDAIHPYHAGGKEVRTRELSRRLKERFEVHVYTMNWWNGPAERIERGVLFRAICGRHPLYTGERRSIMQAVAFALGCFRLLFRRFDLVEVDHMPYLHLFVLKLVCLLRRKKLVVTWHEVWGWRYWLSYLGPLGLIAAVIESLAMRLPDRIIAASDGTAARLREILGSRPVIRVAPNGVDLDEVASAAPCDHPTDLVAVGRLLPHKRMDLLVDVVARLVSAGQPLTCRIIGSGPEAEKLLRQIDRLGLRDHVELRCDVTEHAQLFSLVKSARALVLLSEREGFGIVALEGLACGTRVVTTSAPDNLAKDLVSLAPLGEVCAPDVDSITEAVAAALAAGPPSAAELSELHRWMQQFTWSRIAEEVADVLTGSDAQPGAAVTVEEVQTA